MFKGQVSSLDLFALGKKKWKKQLYLWDIVGDNVYLEEWNDGQTYPETDGTSYIRHELDQLKSKYNDIDIWIA